MTPAGNTGRYSAVLREEAPHIAADAPKPDAPVVEQSGNVAASYGKWRVSMTPMAALVVLACAACAAVGYFASYARGPAVSDPRPLLQEFREAMANQKEDATKREAELNHRLEVLETNLSGVRVSVDSLRDRVNDLRAQSQH